MVVGLKVYKIKNQEIYESLRNLLSGIAFFRKDDNGFYIKSTKNNIIKEFMSYELIEEVKI
jgi:hypothetical protein